MTPERLRFAGAMATLALTLGVACRGGDQEPAPSQAEHENWSVTAWGGHFEIFPEVEPLVAGQAADAHTHVTVLADFSPLRQGTVSAVLRGPAGVQEFAGTFRRDGMYGIEIKPARAGEYDLSFRVKAAGLEEEINGGRVRVGTAGQPGGLVAPPLTPATAAPPAEARGLGFRKEQQWQTPFATAWVQEGTVPASVTGTARVRAAGGGEAVLTAPVDGAVLGAPWPHPGAGMSAGADVLRVAPSVAQERSLPDLRAEVTGLQGELSVAEARLERLQGLLAVEATSAAEVERARSMVTGLRARLTAAQGNLSSARSMRTGGTGGDSLAVRAPWAGQVAALLVSPGQVVAAGTPLARLVKPRPVWLDVALRPEDATRVSGRVDGLVLRRSPGREPLTLADAGLRIVGRSPELDPRTGTVNVTVEVPLGVSELPIGSAVEAEVLLGGGETAVVVPESALVDDGGTMVAYVQLSGESFARREVHVRARRGGVVAVDGLRTGERLVTRGGAAIRRASLLSTGAPEGHVH